MLFAEASIEAVGHLIFRGASPVMPAQLREGSWYEADEKAFVGALISSTDGSYSYTVWIRTDTGDYTRLHCSGSFAGPRDALLDMEQYALVHTQNGLPRK
jgi:hypothetical protein